MNEETIARLETSFSILAPRGDELVDRFYAQLFSANPGVRGLFPQTMDHQKKKLLASLVLVIKSLRKPEELHSALLEMGARHREYGAQPEHYPIVSNTLLGVMRDMAGARWNDQWTEDWTSALEFVSGVLIEGQRIASTVRA